MSSGCYGGDELNVPNNLGISVPVSNMDETQSPGAGPSRSASPSSVSSRGSRGSGSSSSSRKGKERAQDEDSPTANGAALKLNGAASTAKPDGVRNGSRRTSRSSKGKASLNGAHSGGTSARTHSEEDDEDGEEDENDDDDDDDDDEDDGEEEEPSVMLHRGRILDADLAIAH